MRQLLATSSQRIPLALTPIQAGPAAEVGEDYCLLDVNAYITKGREGFVAFEITGDSDVPYICPGYIAFVDTWTEPRHGHIVVAVINGLTCVKKFEHTSRRLRLVSRNEQYQPREITVGDQFHIVGVVAGHLAVYR
jgi:DNA polymerase V